MNIEKGGLVPCPTSRDILLVFMACLPSAAGALQAAVVTVCEEGCDHDVVQEAIGAARPGDTIRLGSGQFNENLTIDRDLTLQGVERDATVLDGDNKGTVVRVTAGATVTLADLTVHDGTAGDGAGIWNLGTLTVINVAVSDNKADPARGGEGTGGGIRNEGTLALRQSSVTGNQAIAAGGGILNLGTLVLEDVTLCSNEGAAGGGVHNTGTLTIRRSLVGDNEVTGDGGGVFTSGQTTIVNCTLTDNSARGRGAGLFSAGAAGIAVELTHVTVTDNSATGGGGGVFNEGAQPIDLANSIVAKNDRGGDCGGAMRSLGYNLDSDETCGLAAGGDKPDLLDANPELSPLGYNGGGSMTHYLQYASPAIDAIGENGFLVSEDQRGIPRPQGGRCDIGAYERPVCQADDSGASFRRGEVDDTGLTNITDAIYLLLFLFLGSRSPPCLDAADADDDGSINLTDPVYILTHLFLNGPGFPEPVSCGPDPTPDSLTCGSARACEAGDEPGRFSGLWTSASELAGKPTAGAAWEAVWTAAQEACSSEARVTNMDSDNNVQILAAGIVYARLAGEDPETARGFRDTVAAALRKLVREGDPRATHGCPASCGNTPSETLSWARETGAYVLAADLIGYRTPEFEEWARSMAEVYVACDGATMLQTFRERPNNWGAMGFGSLAAIYAYLGDVEALESLRDYFTRAVTGRIPDCENVPEGDDCFVWGGSRNVNGKDLTWHCDPAVPFLINPPCSRRLEDGTVVDLGGLIPDDQRRSCSFCPPEDMTAFCLGRSPGNRCIVPEDDVHISDAINGFVMGARILDRVGTSVWDAGDQALKRMAIAHLVTHCQLTCDDVGFSCSTLYNCKDWALPILDQAYDLQAAFDPPPATACKCSLDLTGRGVGASKNAGFGAFIVP